MSYASELRNCLRLQILALLAYSVCAGAQLPPGDADLAQRFAGLEARVEKAESIRAIKRLQYAYGHYVEFGLWHDFADLFTEDAIAHYPAGDLGREAIRDLFFEQVGQGQLGLADGRLYPHFVLQPVVTLDPGGQTAHGRWHVLTLLGGYGGNATWVGGLYENDYVLEADVWKISELRTNTQFSGSYANGWTNPPPASTQPGDICENYLVNDCTIPFHFDAVRAGAPLGPATASVSPATMSVQSIEALSAQVAGVEQRVTRLVDESEVINLQHAYGYYFDRKRWDDVADLFAADATLELGLQGVYRGQASIRRALDQFGASGEVDGTVDDHLQLETIVTVQRDGQTANARGIDFALWSPDSDRESGGEWREAVFENVYKKQDGVWKIASMHLYPRFATDYALGWAEDAQPAPVADDRYPPDEPPTVMHGIYPEFFIPPFHFPNPVTGAPAQYPDGVATSRAPAYFAPDSVAPGEELATAADIRMRLDLLERRFAIASGYDAVENIANAYNYYLDEFDRNAANRIFARNGSAGVYNAEVAGGRELIRAAIDAPRAGGGRPAGFFVIHQTTQPVIHISADGNSAKIRLRLFGSSGRLGEDGAWLAGIYESEAVVENGTWKLRQMPIYMTWAADYSGGWASGAPFARIAAVPFHYDNPVSGRPRPLPAESGRR
jgi:hypothetical protein